MGVIGLGHTGLAAAKIFNGLECNVIGYDVAGSKGSPLVTPVKLNDLLSSADIISIHVPLTKETKHLIQRSTLDQMKNGVMLINTSRGAVINTKDVLPALASGKIGYLGLDVYEYEKDLFFENHENDEVKDQLLVSLLKYPNVLITPHQAFLTKEALQEIANQTIKNLDQWQMNKCVGAACACGNECQKEAHVKNKNIDAH